MLKFCYVGNYNKNVNSGLETQQFRNYVRVGFLIEPSLKLSPSDEMLPSFKRGPIYLLKSTHKSWNHYFVIFWQALQWRWWCNKCAPSTWFTPTNTCPNRNSNDRCLRYLAFECQANFPINWEAFADRDQQKTRLRYDALKLRRRQTSSLGSWTGSTIN